MFSTSHVALQDGDDQTTGGEQKEDEQGSGEGEQGEKESEQKEKEDEQGKKEGEDGQPAVGVRVVPTKDGVDNKDMSAKTVYKGANRATTTTDVGNKGNGGGAPSGPKPTEHPSDYQLQ